MKDRIHIKDELNSKIKASGIFLEEEYKLVLNESDSDKDTFYMNIFYLFEDLFQSINSEDFKKLASFGYCFTRTIVGFDPIIDDKQITNERKRANYKLGFYCLQESVKILMEFFPPESRFWLRFNELQRYYFDAIALEDNLVQGNIEFTEELYLELAKNKTILSLNVISALCHLSGDFTHKEVLEKFLVDLHIGFQILDDVDDIKKDLQEKRKSYSISLIEKSLTENDVEIDKNNFDYIHKYFFVSGIAVKQLEKAVVKFEGCLQAIENLPLKECKLTVENLLNKTNRNIKNIKLLVEKARLKSQKTYTYLHNAENYEYSLENVEKAMELGVKYLFNELNSSNQWTDFLTANGVSTSWVTSFVGFQLSEAGITNKKLYDVADILLSDLPKASGYNERVGQDADSTSFLIGFLNQLNKEVDQDFMDSWFKYQNKDGSWTTYRGMALTDTGEISSYTLPHLCVASAAAYIMGSLNNNDDYREKTINYIENQQLNSGAWESFWWTSNIYSTSFSLLALLTNYRKEHSKAIDSGISYLLNNRKDNGSWVGINDESVFYTALALKPIIFSKPDDNVKLELRKSIDWLLKNQLEDGSWLTQRILRLPDQTVTDPNENVEWKEGSMGRNRIVDDHKRVFTCSVVVNTLKKYLDLHKN